MEHISNIPQLRFHAYTGEWVNGKLGDLAEYITSGSRDWSRYYDNVGSKFIRLTNLPRGGINLLTDKLKYVKLPLDNNEGKRTKLNQGDVLISVTAELGKIGWIPKDFGESYINQHIALVRLNQLVDSKLIAYHLSTNKTNILINRLNDSGAKSGLNLSAVKSIPLIIPSLPEQKKIAAFLSAVDMKIALLTRKKELLEQYKKGVMQKLFNREIRFKDANGNDYPAWEERKFNEILKEHRSKSTGKEEVYSVSVHKGLINQIEHLGRSFAADSTDHYNLVKPYDIVYTKSPTGDFPYGIIKQSKIDRNVIVSPLYGVFTPETKWLGYILNVYFETNVNAYNYLHPIIQKGAKNTINITNTTFLSKGLHLPVSQAEQEMIGLFLKYLDTKIDHLSNIVHNMQLFKKGLLQQMFV